MESLNDTKKRIRSVKNTRQITKAMEVVSATKMRKSQERALKARGYALGAFELLANLDKHRDVKKPALFIRPEGRLNASGVAQKKTLLVVITSDKGLAGSLNSNVLKKAFVWYKKEMGNDGMIDSSPKAQNDKQGVILSKTKDLKEVDLVVAGKKANAFFKFRKVPVAKAFFGHGDFGDFDEVKEMTEFVKTAFLSGDYSRVVAIYTNFRSTLKQEAVIREVLPLKNESLQEFINGLLPEKGKYSDATTNYELRTTNSPDYLFEPSPERVFKELSERLFQMIIYHIILEANASEHSARMVAMKTASENAAEIVDDLTLLYNKGRQSKITQELVEITSGSDAVA